MAAVLGTVRSVDLTVEVGLGGRKDHFFLDAARPDLTFVANLYAAEPCGAPPVRGSDVKVAADADRPDRHWLSRRAVASERRDPQFFRGSYFVELLAGPRRHRRLSL
jgi:hypothetical protein